jgi:hypothetical protein
MTDQAIHQSPPLAHSPVHAAAKPATVPGPKISDPSRHAAELREDAARKKAEDAKKAAEPKIPAVTLANADFAKLSPIEALELLRAGKK